MVDIFQVIQNVLHLSFELPSGIDIGSNYCDLPGRHGTERPSVRQCSLSLSTIRVDLDR